MSEGHNTIKIEGSSIQGNVIAGSSNDASYTVNNSPVDQNEISAIVVELNELIQKCLGGVRRELTRGEELDVIDAVVEEIPKHSTLGARLKSAGQEAVATAIEKSIEKIHSSVAISALISGVKRFIQGA